MNDKAKKAVDELVEAAREFERGFRGGQNFPTAAQDRRLRNARSKVTRMLRYGVDGLSWRQIASRMSRNVGYHRRQAAALARSSVGARIRARARGTAP